MMHFNYREKVRNDILKTYLPPSWDKGVILPVVIFIGMKYHRYKSKYLCISLHPNTSLIRCSHPLKDVFIIFSMPFICFFFFLAIKQHGNEYDSPHLMGIWLGMFFRNSPRIWIAWWEIHNFNFTWSFQIAYTFKIIFNQ